MDLVRPEEGHEAPALHRRQGGQAHPQETSHSVLACSKRQTDRGLEGCRCAAGSPPARQGDSRHLQNLQDVGQTAAEVTNDGAARH